MIDFSRLKTWLQQADLQKKNFPLYQLLEQLITFIIKEQGTTNTSISGNAGNISVITNADLLTHSDEIATLPFSRELLAGNSVNFDDSALGARTVNVEKEETYITVDDEVAALPNSRQLVAGINITFDTSVAGEIKISAPDTVTHDYVVMSDGGNPPLPVNDGFGNFIYVEYAP